MALPAEVLENIFKYLDGASLRNASMVNHLWHQEVNRVSLVHNNWERICLDEIPHNVLEEISLHNTLDLPVVYGFAPDYGEPKEPASPSHDWRTVYMNWRRWSAMPDWICVPRSIATPGWMYPGEDILCLKISGEFVVTGHVGGCVMMWNTYPDPVAIGYPHVRNIVDMMCLEIAPPPQDINAAVQTATVSTEPPPLPLHCDSQPGHDLVVTVSDDGRVAMTWLTRYYLTDGGDRVLKPGPYLPKMHDQPTKTIRAINSSVFAVISVDWTLSLWQVKGSMPEVQLLLHCHSDELSALRLKKIGMPPSDLVSRKLMSLSRASYNYHMLKDGPSDERDRSWGKAFFRNSVAISVEMNVTCTLVITVMDNADPPNVATAHYNVMSMIPSEPTSWLLYGQVLILGLRSGSVLIYRVRNDLDLLHLNVAHPDWQGTFGRHPIIALGVTDGLRPCIAAANRTQVYHLWFHHPQRDNYRYVPNDPFLEDELLAMQLVEDV